MKRRSDRPWYRHCVRVGIRLLLGTKKAHYQDWLPGLSLLRSDDETRSRLFYKGRFITELQAKEALCRRSSGTVHIVGSGPSIQRMDIELLPARSAVLLNGAVSLIEKKIPDPLAVVVEDERFVYRHFETLLAKVPSGTTCLFSVSVLRAICEFDPDWLANKKIIVIDNILKPYGAPRLSIMEAVNRQYVMVSDDGTTGFSTVPDRGVFQAGSVVISALQFVMSCNLKAIGFIGVDISNAKEPRFYEKSQETAFSGVAEAEERILEHIRLAHVIAQRRNIQFLNFSPVSALAKLGLQYDPRLTLDIDDGV